ncbi:MAG: ATP-dependent DNA helicase RecG [Clostridia bacterium]|nr:ATP-dependent DNA helicase RecG [Clostridia bacterium]
MLSSSSLVTTMRGVGDARAAALASLGILTVGDLLHHYPRGYQCRGDVRSVEEARRICEEGGETPISLILTVSAEPSFRVIRRGMSVLKFRAFDDTGVCEITYFNQNYLRDTFHTGGEFRFFGKVSAEGKRLSMTAPIWEPMVPGRILPAIVPVYPLAAGLTQKFVSGLIRDALASLSGQIAETLPDDVIRRESLCTLRYATENIHFPPDGEALAKARRRLIFEEFFEMGLAMTALTSPKSSPGYPMPETDTLPLQALLPYALTGAQKRSVSEIAADLSSGVRMNRILMGDVGSGKTVVAAAAAYIAAQNGFQSAIMAPTEILAVQHYREMEPLLGQLGIRVVCLTGSDTAAQKKKIRAAIADPANPASVVIGTHALLSAGVDFVRLGLVIEDEQHRFGVMQRAALAEKDPMAHILVMSATPIPRTLSLVTCGGLAVSRLDEMPPGRQVVDTFVVDDGYRTRLNGFIRKQVEEGHQVYIVCPSVEEEKKAKITDDPEEMASILLDGGVPDEKPPLKAAVDFAAELAEVFPDLSVGFVHGKMKTADKDKAMRAFASGEMHILVSTTVIEVGVNVPNATLMIVENAERFGLSQLHQLRGRVGRGKAKSYCVLVSDSKAETARERLAVLKKNHDGYAIAEADLRLRGPGDFLSTGGVVRQHGTMPLTLAAGLGDMDVMDKAFDAARTLLEEDPALSLPEHAALREAVNQVRQAASSTMN